MNSAPGPVVDVGVVRYTTSEILPKNVQAKAEQSEASQKLIPSLSDAEIEEVSITASGHEGVSHDKRNLK